MRRKKFCFRFDVDTHVCLSKGMPNLLALANELEVAFTFFVNMGKGFDRLNSIKNILERAGGTRETDSNTHLSMFSKLGRDETLKAMLFNPSVGAKYHEVLRAAVSQGHELGLHGGRNHAHWEKKAFGWDYNRLYSEVKYGLDQFEIAKLPKPTSFASPAWKSPDALQDVLVALKFTVCADTKSLNDDSVRFANGLHHIPTNILGRSEEVGYIENLRAAALGDQDILADFERQALAKDKLAVVYEHPFYAGVHELELLRQMIKIVKNLGYEVTTIDNMVS